MSACSAAGVTELSVDSISGGQPSTGSCSHASEENGLIYEPVKSCANIIAHTWINICTEQAFQKCKHTKDSVIHTERKE